MAIRFILFDAVGTLIYPEPSVAAAYEAAGRAHGVELPQREIRARFAGAYARVFRALDTGATDESRERQRWRSVVGDVFHEWPQFTDELLEHLWQHFADVTHWSLFEDVAETWSMLSARGYALGIASNFDSRLRQILKGHACLAACPRVFVSTEMGYSKPNERFFSEIERRLGALPQQMLMVGDDEENDIVAPRRRGWQAVALTRNSHRASGIRSLSELARFLP